MLRRKCDCAQKKHVQWSLSISQSHLRLKGMKITFTPFLMLLNIMKSFVNILEDGYITMKAHQTIAADKKLLLQTLLHL